MSLTSIKKKKTVLERTVTYIEVCDFFFLPNFDD